MFKALAKTHIRTKATLHMMAQKQECLTTANILLFFFFPQAKSADLANKNTWE